METSAKKLMGVLCIIATLMMAYKLWPDKNKDNQSGALPPDVRTFVNSLPSNIQETSAGEIQDLIKDFNRYKALGSQVKFELQGDGFTVTGQDGNENVYGITQDNNTFRTEFLKNSHSEIGFSYAKGVLERIDIKQAEGRDMNLVEGYSRQDHGWLDLYGELVPPNRVSERIEHAAHEGGFLPNVDIVTRAVNEVSNSVAKLPERSNLEHE